MTRRAWKLIALALAAFGFLFAATYRPFGGGQPSDPTRIADPADSGHWTGFDCGMNLAIEEVRRFKTPERIAQYLATKNGIAKEQRDVWCAAFVKGFNAGMEQRFVRGEK